jgi:hypothetical protein
VYRFSPIPSDSVLSNHHVPISHVRSLELLSLFAISTAGLLVISDYNAVIFHLFTSIQGSGYLCHVPLKGSL